MLVLYSSTGTVPSTATVAVSCVPVAMDARMESPLMEHSVLVPLCWDGTGHGGKVSQHQEHEL